MRFAIAIPQGVTDGSFDPAAMRTYLAKAEEFGFESAWTGEQVLGTLPLLSPLEVLSYAAAYTRWIRLGCAMLVSPLHNPVHLAKTIASVDQLSRGRLDVGLVTGGPFRTFSAFEVDPASYLDRFSQGLELMRQLWTSPRIDFDGQFWQLLNAAMEPKPFQKPYPPIWFGGSHPDALRRAVPLAHGFIGAGTSTTAQFAEHARNVRQELHRQHRDPKTSSLPWSAGDGPEISSVSAPESPYLAFIVGPGGSRCPRWSEGVWRTWTQWSVQRAARCLVCRLPIRSAGRILSFISRTTVGRLTPRRSAACCVVRIMVCGAMVTALPA